MLISEITSGKGAYMNLLLIGDEQQDMVELYLENCRLFIGFIDNEAVGCIACTEVSDTLVEVKNLAVTEGFRNRGIGRSLLEHIESLYPHRDIQLGTGETPSTLRFYANCGYRYSHRIADFFTAHYTHPIIEEGVVLRDMVYLRKRAQRNGAEQTPATKRHHETF
ncbi:MAG: GNAT family N-acetyltransferase [Muribaculaceae bacterium]|nr:GNAT family N-acetyltransferase [Muribaculaceae bacterium]